jgi:hypothetical protein
MAEIIKLKRKGDAKMNDMTTTITPPAPLRIATVIPLTHHASVRIFLDEWEVIAAGSWSNGHSDNPDHQELGVRVLMLRNGEASTTIGDGTTIVQAWAESHDPDDERLAECVTVGRLLTFEETSARGSCDPHILAVADELRERISDERLRRRVTAVVDACFRSFTPWTMGRRRSA